MKKSNIIILVVGALALVALIVVGLLVSPTPEETAARDEQTPQSEVASFYEGRSITFIVPYDPGGGYDEYSRLIAPYLEKHTGARVDILNLPGAGGMRGVNDLYNSPRNGLTIGIMNGSALVTNELAGMSGAEYRIAEFSYLGRIVADTRVMLVSTESEYDSFQDLWDAGESVRIGATGLGGSTYVDAVISREAFNLDYQIIHGFDSSSVVRQAMLRGNIVGTWGSWGSAEEGVDTGRETIILQSGRERIPDIPDAPTVFEMLDRTENPERTRAILTAWDSLISVGRPVAAPPGIPASRLRFLREAFRNALQDPDFIEATQKVQRPTDYASGEEMSKIVQDATMMEEDIKQLFIQAIRGQL